MLDFITLKVRYYYFSSLTLLVPIPGRREKLNLNFYFHTSLRCLLRFYERLKGIYKTFRGTTKQKSENKNLSYFFTLIQLFEMHRVGRVNISTHFAPHSFLSLPPEKTSGFLMFSGFEGDQRCEIV